MSFAFVSAAFRRLLCLALVLGGCGKSSPAKPNPSELERLEARVVEAEGFYNSQFTKRSNTNAFYSSL